MTDHDQHDQHDHERRTAQERAAEVVAATLRELEAGPAEIDAAYGVLRDACAAYSDAHERAGVLGLTGDAPTPRSLRGYRAVEATTRGRRRATRKRAA